MNNLNKTQLKERLNTLKDNLNNYPIKSGAYKSQLNSIKKITTIINNINYNNIEIINTNDFNKLDIEFNKYLNNI